jgi:hypothetical protein
MHLDLQREKEWRREGMLGEKAQWENWRKKRYIFF